MEADAVVCSRGRGVGPGRQERRVLALEDGRVKRGQSRRVQSEVVLPHGHGENTRRERGQEYQHECYCCCCHRSNDMLPSPQHDEVSRHFVGSRIVQVCLRQRRPLPTSGVLSFLLPLLS